MRESTLLSSLGESSCKYKVLERRVRGLAGCVEGVRGCVRVHVYLLSDNGFISQVHHSPKRSCACLLLEKLSKS